MGDRGPSRRGLFRSTGGALLAGTIGAGAAPVVREGSGRTEDLPPIVDVHAHVVPSNLPGVPVRAGPAGPPLDDPAEAVARAIRDEMAGAGVGRILGMPRREVTEADPLGIAGTERLAALIPGLRPIGLADPDRVDPAHLARVETALKAKSVVALKAYLGYIYHGPDSPGYRPYYELAGAYKVPVIFHTGDTYSHLAKLKYAQPLLVDEVAVDHPGTRFVLAHFGNPWLIDAAEVVFKNNRAGVRENVWADLSGLLVGSPADFDRFRRDGLIRAVADEVRRAFLYADRPDRFLYGGDWPLAPMAAYRDFVREVVPEAHHRAVFADNARALFGLA